nr:MAG TPA: hypothetical protein [Caudoviricetes sp.]
MKLSDIKGEEVFDVIGEVAGPIASIATDDKVIAAAKACQGKSNSEVVRWLVPVIFKDHRDDLVAVLAAVNLTTTEEYMAGVTMPKLIADVADVLGDSELLAFFG